MKIKFTKQADLPLLDQSKVTEATPNYLSMRSYTKESGEVTTSYMWTCPVDLVGHPDFVKSKSFTEDQMDEAYEYAHKAYEAILKARRATKLSGLSEAQARELGTLVEAYMDDLSSKGESSYTHKQLTGWKAFSNFRYTRKGKKMSVRTMQILDIDVPVATDIIAQFKATGESDWIVDNAIITLTSAWKAAMMRGFVPTCPWADPRVTPKRAKKRSKLSQDDLWKPEDISTFCDQAALSSSPWMAVFAHLMYESGQRMGDVREMMWEELGFSQNAVTLVQNKTGSQVANIKLPLHVHTMLKAHRKAQVEQFGILPEYVFPNSYGMPYKVPALSKIASRIQDKAGLGHLKFSKLRATALNELMNTPGMTDNLARSVSGHAKKGSLEFYATATTEGAALAQDMRHKARGIK